MLNFDTQKLRSGPNRTKADSIRWKCCLTRLLPNNLASRSVTNSRTAFRSRRRNFPGCINSAATLCNFSTLMTDVKPFEEFSVFRFMFPLLMPALVRAWTVQVSLSFDFVPSYSSVPHFLLSMKGPPLPVWDSATLSLSDMQGSTWFLKIQPFCPLHSPQPSPLHNTHWKWRHSDCCCWNWPHSSQQTMIRHQSDKTDTKLYL